MKIWIILDKIHKITFPDKSGQIIVNRGQRQLLLLKLQNLIFTFLAISPSNFELQRPQVSPEILTQGQNEKNYPRQSRSNFKYLWVGTELWLQFEESFDL